MAVQASDIKVRLSVTSGAAGNSVAQGSPVASLGKYMATTDLVDNVLQNLFASISAAEGVSGVTKYLCLFLYNSHATQTWQNAVVWLASQLAGGSDIAIGLDPAGAQTYNQAGAQAAQIASITTAPAGVTFSQPTDQASALAIGNLAAGKCIGLWIRQTTAPDTAAQTNDNAVLSYYGTSDP